MTENEAIKWQKQIGEVYKGFHLDIEEKMNDSCDMAINALEKQIAKKMVIKNDNGRTRRACGGCGCFVLPTSRFCSKCGQKLDWSDEK